MSEIKACPLCDAEMMDNDYDSELGKPLEYTGRSLSRIVNEVREGYGLRDGYCVLGCDKI